MSRRAVTSAYSLLSICILFRFRLFFLRRYLVRSFARDGVRARSRLFELSTNILYVHNKLHFAYLARFIIIFGGAASFNRFTL